MEEWNNGILGLKRTSFSGAVTVRAEPAEGRLCADKPNMTKLDEQHREKE